MIIRTVTRETIRCGLRRAATSVAAMLLLLVASGCVTPRRAPPPPLTANGEIFLYLAPLGQDSSGISFSIADAAAMRDDGESIPLTLLLETPTKGHTERQRLLARGVLPPGNYQGIRFRLSRASMETEDGPAAMLVPELGETARLRFEILRQKGTVLEVAFNGAAARAEGISLRPAFTVAQTPPPLPSLTGYLTLPEGNRVLIFDKRNGTVGRSLATGAGPSGVALDTAARRGYLSLSGDDSIAVVDLADHEIRHHIRLNQGDHPRDMALAGNGSVLLVANEGSNSVSFVDPAGLRELGRIATGFGPTGIAVDRGGTLACVCNSMSQSVSIIDVASRQRIADLSTDPDPVLCQFSAAGSRLIVGHRRTPHLFLYDLPTRTLLDRLTVFGGVSALKADTKNERFYAASAFGGPFAVFNTTVRMPIDFVAAHAVTGQLTIDGEENTLLAVQPADSSLRIVELIGKRERTLVEAGDPPYRVAVAGER